MHSWVVVAQEHWIEICSDDLSHFKGFCYVGFKNKCRLSQTIRYLTVNFDDMDFTSTVKVDRMLEVVLCIKQIALNFSVLIATYHFRNHSGRTSQQVAPVALHLHILGT